MLVVQGVQVVKLISKEIMISNMTAIFDHKNDDSFSLIFLIRIPNLNSDDYHQPPKIKL